MYNEAMLLKDLIRAYREKDKQAIREINARLANLRDSKKPQLTTNALRPVQKGI